MQWTTTAPTAPGDYLVWIEPLPWAEGVDEGAKVGAMLSDGTLYIEPGWFYSPPAYADQVSCIESWAKVDPPSRHERISSNR